MTYTPSLTPQGIAERHTWQYKTVAYTHGNKSQLGALLQCETVAKAPGNPPL